MILSTGYTFTPGASGSGTINFSGVASFNPSQLLGVKHIPSGKTLYAPLTSARGTFSGSTLTLSVDTSAMNASDLLLVSYGSNALGAPSDSSASSDTGAFSLVALKKRGLVNWTTLLGRVPGTVAQDGADPASPSVANQGTGIRGWLATIAALLRLGTQTSANSASVVIATDLTNLEPAGAKITAAAMPAGGVGLTGWLSAIWYALTSGLVLGVSTNIIGRIAAGTAYTESTAALGAAGTFAGASRNTGYGQNVQTAFAYFTGVAFADQTGTLFVETSPDGTNWYAMNGTAGTAVAAGATVIVKVPAAINLMRVRYTNGGTAQTKFLLTSMFSVS
jgi:hypothetical protein